MNCNQIKTFAFNRGLELRSTLGKTFLLVPKDRYYSSFTSSVFKGSLSECLAFLKSYKS